MQLSQLEFSGKMNRILLVSIAVLSFVSAQQLKSCTFERGASLEFGYLTHKNYPQVLGAVSLAVENINQDKNILPNTELKFKFAALTRSPKNDRLEALQRMTDFRDRGISAFIGPDESCRDEALVASAWNLPMIAFVSGIQFLKR